MLRNSEESSKNSRVASIGPKVGKIGARLDSGLIHVKSTDSAYRGYIRKIDKMESDLTFLGWESRVLFTLPTVWKYLLKYPRAVSVAPNL